MNFMKKRTPNEKRVDKVAEIIAIHLATAFLRGQLDNFVLTEKREDYQCAREILKALKLPTT